MTTQLFSYRPTRPEDYYPDAVGHNYQYLKEYIFPNIKTRKREREFDSWYHRIFTPIFRSPNDTSYFIYDPYEQTGGGDYIYTRNEGNQQYHIRIRHLEMRDEKGENHGELYLMSPIDDNREHRCLFARITKKKPNIVELMDLILANNCTDLHKTPHKIGRVYVDVMTKYLIEHRRELGINRIELTDNAYYRCPQKRHLSIHLEKSRQLEGDDPYYIQFGYRPKYLGSQRKLDYNKRRMSQIMTCDDKGLKQLCQAYGCNQRIMDYIRTYQDQPMSKTLKYLGRSDCVAYYEIHRRMFDNCGLKELESPIYIMELYEELYQ